MKQKKLIFNFFVIRNWKTLTHSRKRAKILAGNRKSHHSIETLFYRFVFCLWIRESYCIPQISSYIWTLICNSKGKDEFYRQTTGSLSSKYEHWRASALLPYLKRALRLSCVVHGQIYGRFMGFYMNGFKPLYREKTVHIKKHKN